MGLGFGVLSYTALFLCDIIDARKLLVLVPLLHDKGCSYHNYQHTHKHKGGKFELVMLFMW